MDVKFFTYANIIRVLKHDPANDRESLMIDIDTKDNSILKIFDTSERPLDLIFINSFVHILTQSTAGFKQTDDEKLKDITIRAIRNNLPDISL